MEGVIVHKIEDLLGIRGERPTLYEESRNLEEIKYERVPALPAIRGKFSYAGSTVFVRFCEEENSARVRLIRSEVVRKQ